MVRKLMVAASVAAIFAAGSAAAQVTLYGQEGFRGRAVTIEREARNLERMGFNDRVSSYEVDAGFNEKPPHDGHRRPSGRNSSIGRATAASMEGK